MRVQPNFLSIKRSFFLEALVNLFADATRRPLGDHFAAQLSETKAFWNSSSADNVHDPDPEDFRPEHRHLVGRKNFAHGLDIMADVASERGLPLYVVQNWSQAIYSSAIMREIDRQNASGPLSDATDRGFRLVDAASEEARVMSFIERAVEALVPDPEAAASNAINESDGDEARAGDDDMSAPLDPGLERERKGVPRNPLVVDYYTDPHPSRLGHFIIARELYKAFVADGVLPDSESRRERLGDDLARWERMVDEAQELPVENISLEYVYFFSQADSVLRAIDEADNGSHPPGESEQSYRAPAPLSPGNP